MGAKTPQNKYRNSLCILCYKSATIAMSSSHSSGSSESSRFISVLCRHLQISSNFRAKQVFDPDLTVMCEDCALFCSSFSQLYFQLECIQLKLNWKLKKMLEMMICAGRVSSRYQSFCKQFEVSVGGDEDVNELEKHRDKVLAFRKLIIKTCKRKLKNSQPQVKLTRSDAAKSSISSLSPSTSSQIKTENFSSPPPRQPPTKLSATAVTSTMDQKPCRCVFREYSTQTQPQSQNPEEKIISSFYLLTFHALLSLASIKTSLPSCEANFNNLLFIDEDFSSEVDDYGAQDEDDVISLSQSEDEDIMQEPAPTLEEHEEREENYIQKDIPIVKTIDNVLSINQEPMIFDKVVTEKDNPNPVIPKKEVLAIQPLTSEPDSSLYSSRSSLRALLKCKECSKTFTNQYSLSLHQKFHEEMKSRMTPEEKNDKDRIQSGRRGEDVKNNLQNDSEEESECEFDDIWSLESKKIAANQNDPLKLSEDLCLLGGKTTSKDELQSSSAEDELQSWSGEDDSIDSSSSEDEDEEKILKTPLASKKTNAKLGKGNIRSADIPPTTCEQCGFTFECEAAVEKHRVMEHNIKDYVWCPICCRMYPGFPKYFKHRTKHKGGTEKRKCYIHANLLNSQIHQFPFPKSKSLPYLFCPEEGCYEVFAFKQYLDVHLKTHGIWRCTYCLKDFGKAHDFAWHEITEHKKIQQEEPLSDQGFQCTRCDRKFDRKNFMISHFLHKHLDIPAPAIQNIEKMEENPKESVRDEDKKQCPVCSRTFLPNCTEISVKLHMKWHDVEGMDPSEISTCRICNAPFKLPHLLSMHLKTVHLLKKPHECPQCPSKFKCSSLLRLHLKKVHKESVDSAALFKGKFKCDICGERFGFEGNLKQHKKIHGRNNGASGISKGSYFQPGNFKCDKCDDERVFLTKMKLYMHQRNMHMKPKQTWCCDKCGNVFKSKQKLEQHESYRHTDPNDWKFVCSVEGCGRKCFSKQKLGEHLRTHTKECPFICDFCGKKFRYRQYLRAHLLKLHGPSAAATLPGRKYFKPFNQREEEKEAELDL
ncbi:unnamed protein product [Orchesella dallaii]|uniref:C2H2-type domain-containing protein n=1 Tax=Orchesella dallaii TaxID=48710 RepID=A0ABP1S1B2_9HEXA